MGKIVIYMCLFCVVFLIGHSCITEGRTDYILYGICKSPATLNSSINLLKNGQVIGNVVTNLSPFKIIVKQGSLISIHDTLAYSENILGSRYIEVLTNREKRAEKMYYQPGDTVNIQVLRTIKELDTIKRKQVIKVLDESIKNLDSILKN